MTAGDVTVSAADILGSPILIVDDELVNVDLLTGILRREGFTNIVATTDSRQAVPLFVERRPDLVLLDLKMPNMDGFAVMDGLRREEHGEFLPVLVLTGENDPANRLMAFKCGARDFILKPIHVEEMMARIRNLLEVRLFQRALNSQNALLETRILERTSELEDSRLDALTRLVAAIEWRDADTGDHVARIGRICRRLGHALGLDGAACDMLSRTAPLHDVGKVGIPDSILLKSGPLTPEEWAVMKTHTTIGGRILDGSPSGLIQAAREIALTHHERWDGSGYPQGIRGGNIPLGGRICAVADVFDATMAKRCYKPAYPMEVAVRYIRGASGGHFDPAVVGAFDRALPEIAKLFEPSVDQPAREQA